MSNNNIKINEMISKSKYINTKVEYDLDELRKKLLGELYFECKSGSGTSEENLENRLNFLKKNEMVGMNFTLNNLIKLCKLKIKLKDKIDTLLRYDSEYKNNFDDFEHEFQLSIIEPKEIQIKRKILLGNQLLDFCYKLKDSKYIERIKDVIEKRLKELEELKIDITLKDVEDICLMDNKINYINTTFPDLKKQIKDRDLLLKKYKDNLLENYDEDKKQIFRPKKAGIIFYRQRINSLEIETLAVKSNSDIWSFPKGHMEEDDKDLFTTALRELKEETGIIIDYEDFIELERIEQIRTFNLKTDRTKYYGIKVDDLINLNKKYMQYFIRDYENLDEKVLLEETNNEVKKMKWITKDDFIIMNNTENFNKAITIYFEKYL